MKKPLEKLLIIDGHAMAFRAHFAMARAKLTNSSGMPTEAVVGFFKMLGKLLQDYKPQYLLLTFDPGRKTFRSKIYPKYKANRKETAPELKWQFDEIQDIVKKLKLPIYIPKEEEADDAIATIAKREKDSDIDIFLVSSDKDLYNVLYPNVKLLRARKGVTDLKVIDSTYVSSKLGISIKEIPDFMALTGDSSDNVPGVKGIGEKSAVKLIQEYHSIKNIYENIDKVAPTKIREKLITDKENAFLSLDLVTLKKDMDISLKLKDLEVEKISNLGKSISIFKEKGYTTIYQEWGNLFENESARIEVLKNTFLIRNKKEWKEIETKIKKSSEIAFDTETTSLNPVEAKLVGISLSWQKGKEYFSLYLPCLFDTESERSLEYQGIPEGTETIEWIRPILEDKKILKIGQNIKYDSLILKRHGVDLKNVAIDTMLLSYMLDPNSRRHGLDELALNLLGHSTIKYKDLVGTGKKERPLASVSLEELAIYAAEDAEITLRIKNELLPKLKDKELKKLYQKIDFPLVSVLMKMEENGICIDREYLKEIENNYQKRINKIEKKIYKLAGEEFKIQSTKELQRILFEKLGIVSKKKTEKGQMSTEQAVLEFLREQHPIINEILEYRTLAKLLSTYIRPLPEYITKDTLRVHTSFSQTIAATGRLASKNPNLQNIPIKGEDGRAIRRAFIVPEGYSLLSLDYSQIELRILAHYSEDKNLIQAYSENQDIHDQATYLLFRNRFNPKSKKWLESDILGNQISSEIEWDILEKMKETPEYSDKRSQAKVLNFSIVYGVTDFGLSRNLGISREESKALIEAYFLSFPGIKKFMEEVVEEAREKGFVTNYFGRKRTIHDFKSQNRFAKEGAKRLAINTPIQSTAADIIKIAMIEIQKTLEKEKFKSKMLLQIHDELVFEVPNDEKEEIYSMVVEKMEGVVNLKVPLKVSGGFGANWDEAK